MNAILIPMKQLSMSKQRLAPFLKGEKKNIFVSLMFEDVIKELLRCKLVDDIFVVTSDLFIKKIANNYNVFTINDTGIYGLNRAIEFGFKNLIDLGYKNITVLPGDIPLVKACEVDSLYSHSTTASIVSSQDGKGTNGLRLMKPFEFKYGENSFQKHKSQFKNNDISYTEENFEGMSLDIDYLVDLKQYIIRNQTKLSSRYLIESGFFKK